MFLPTGVAHLKNQPPLVVWQTLQSKQASKKAFKFNVRDTHYLFNELLPPLRGGLWTPNLETQILAGMFSIFVYVYMFQSKSDIHHVIQVYLLICTSCSQLDKVKFVTIGSSQFSWNDDIFCFRVLIMKLASTCKWHIKTNANNSEHKCPQLQRW